MATKQEELSDPNSTWNRASPETPVFVMDATNMLAPFMVRQHARHYLMLNGQMVNVGTETKPVLRLQYPPEVQAQHDAWMKLAAQMEAWHHRSIPS